MKKLLVSTGVLLVLLLLLMPRPRLLLALSTGTEAPTDTTKIPIVGARWYQLNNVSNGLDGLFDGNTSQEVNTGYGKLLTNYDAYYPLRTGEQMTIERIRMYDGNGTNVDAPLTISIITDTWERIPIAQFIGDKYDTWVGPDPSKPDVFTLTTPVTGARYLVINTSGAYPTELEFYGSYKPGLSPTPAPTRNTPLAQQLGVNVFEWNIESAEASWQVDETRIPPLKGFTAIRHYMDWEKLESTPGQYTFNPTLSGNWNYDAIYERMQTEGIEVLACLKTLPKWLENTYPDGQRDYENVPAIYGRDLTKPASYVEQARVAFQYAARYGQNKKVDPALVTVSPVKTWAGINSVKIGLGLIRYIECDNERDKTWKGRNAYQTAREYAANLSAFYDGHKNTLGPGVGVKNADPAMLVAIGGLAASTTDYVRGMIDWCREFRGYKADGSIDLCWDIINQHLYANDAGTSQDGGGTRGAAPEVSGVGAQAAAFVQLSHELANDRPVWITEAGYDTNPGSPLRAIGVGDKTVEQTQADWILRTALLYNRVGIDRLFFYQLYDEDPKNPTQFSSMGLINGDKSRKPAADFLRQVNNLLGAYRFSDTVRVTNGPARLIIDRYEPGPTVTGLGERRSAYVLLIGDERGRTGTYNLPVPRGDTVQLCIPTIGRSTMTRSRLVSRNGTVPVPVSETPVFVMPGAGPPLIDDSHADLSSLQVFPNPTADYVDIVLTNDSEQPVRVDIYSITGQLRQSAQFVKADPTLSGRINLANLPHGVYLLSVQQGQSRTVRKIIHTQ
ncbi:putative secreted protein (Por secretion system target) [Spirosoma oryzae]|uniref:Putative secreted protein (Por secretion system target) n=1 Tax=Spirosoma oryzae TaxID=1469603 RepID=A0A2T0T352_9BACT|nr:T9SS type A sorting domain-containing protein [Spirosoma oryzae]PRY40086.1 putative secreted protein (Por secretion system target) [Spirosoma oryzae]